MKIQYTQFAPDPSLRGTIKNLPAHVAQVLIAQNVAVHVPYTSVKDRIESEASLLPKPKPIGVEWGIMEGNLSEYSRPAIIRRDANGTTYFASPTPDTPPAIAEQFRQLTDGAEPAMIAPDYAAVLAEGALVGDSNKHRPIYMGKDKEGKPVYINPEEFVSRK